MVQAPLDTGELGLRQLTKRKQEERIGSKNRPNSGFAATALSVEIKMKATSI